MRYVYDDCWIMNWRLIHEKIITKLHYFIIHIEFVVLINDLFSSKTQTLFEIKARDFLHSGLEGEIVAGPRIQDLEVRSSYFSLHMISILCVQRF